MPDVPDFNQATIAMGQQLLNPPSVAGWAGGKAWITPGLLIARNWAPTPLTARRPTWKRPCA